jgi:sugar phosphate isomerase/epimerase
MVSGDPLVRIDYCRQLAIPVVQESAKSIPSAVARGWPTAEELREYRKPFDEAGIAIIGLEPVKEPVREWVEETDGGRESYEVFARHLDAAGAVGIPCVTLHPPLDGATSPDEAAAQFARNCAFYERAALRAREAGTKLATHSPWPPTKDLWGAREYDSLFDAVPAPENGMIFCFGCLAMSGDDVRAVMPRFIERTFMVHLRDVVIHADGQVDEVFPAPVRSGPTRRSRSSTSSVIAGRSRQSTCRSFSASGRMRLPWPGRQAIVMAPSLDYRSFITKRCSGCRRSFRAPFGRTLHRTE